MFLIYYLLILLSIVGYGNALSKILSLNTTNFGFLGILGISFLTLISYVSSLFISHGYFFNILILLLGLIFFLMNLEKKNIRSFLKLLAIFIILIIFIYVKKNHDDFGYYHFPYISIITQIEHPIGLGQLNNGFRNHSSIFFLSSLFYLPLVGINLLHIAPVYFLGFSNFIFLEYVKDKKIFNKFKFINFFALLVFSFVNIFFYRLAEHGTDRSGMILIFLLTLLILSLQNIKFEKIDHKKIYFILILTTLLISLKTYYIIYIPLVFYAIISVNISFILRLLKIKTFYYCLIFFIITIFYNFINSGCLIYPALLTCFDNLYWSLDSNVIIETNIWYELWAKAGATPEFVVKNRSEYIENFNWLSNWIENYFFNKVSDFILGLIAISVIFLFIFKSKSENFLSSKYKYIYILSLIFLLYLIFWFMKHPALRYGGYHIFAILVFLYLCILLNNYKITFNTFYKKSILIILITSFVFFGRNVHRVIKENKIYGQNSFINYQYDYDKVFYNRYLDIIYKDKKLYKKYYILGKEFLITKN